MSRDIVFTHAAFGLSPLEAATIRTHRVLTECGIRVPSHLISDIPSCPRCIYESTVAADLAAADQDQTRIENELTDLGNPSRRPL